MRVRFGALVGVLFVVVGGGAGATACRSILDVEEIRFEAAPVQPDCDPARDRASDPRHCGRCGLDCSGGACVGGKCAPYSLAARESEIVSLSIDGQRAYWVERDGTFFEMPLQLDGGTPTQIAVDAGVVATTLRGDDLYFATAAGTIHRTQRGGAVVRTLATRANGVTALAVDDAFVYVVYGDGARIGAVPVSGGALELRLDVKVARTIAVPADGGAVLWTEADEVFAERRAIAIALPPGSFTTATSLTEGAPGPVSVAIAGERVSWAELGPFVWAIKRSYTVADAAGAETIAEIDAVDVSSVAVAGDRTCWVRSKREIHCMVAP